MLTRRPQPDGRAHALKDQIRTLIRIAGFVLLAMGWGLSHAQLDASRWWINAGFYSYHFDRDKGLRNANPGLGFEYTLNEDWGLTAGRFVNSDDARSSYLGAYYQPWHLGDWKLGAVGGVFNGYPKAFHGGWFPAVLPVATGESVKIGLNVAWVPPFKDRLYGAISLQLKFKFKE